ncbi:MAG: SMI1/KNR4 family protein [Armatimonas sp.]
MADVIWGGAASPIDRFHIERAEAFLGVRFPADFVECVLENNGGRPEPGWIQTSTGGHELFDHLISFDKEERDHIVIVAAYSYWYLPVKLIPFAEDGNGNSFVFDFRTTPEAPTIVFLFHEQHLGEDRLITEDGLIPVATNFTELLSNLRTDPYFDDEDGQ